MKRNIFIPFFIFSIFVGPLARCQPSVSFFVKGTYNYFAMDDLKGIQHELLSDLTTMGIPAKITDAYSPFYGMQVGVMIPLGSAVEPTVFLGGLVDYSSTGGRIHYKDYSGEVKNDQIVVAYSYGAILTNRIFLSPIIELDLSISARLVSSYFKMISHWQVGDQIQDLTLNFSASSYGFEPCIMPCLRLSTISLGLSISYFLYAPKELEYEGHTDVNLFNKAGNKVTIDWTGLKFGLMFCYNF
jgi:hypothetical protein